MKVFIKVICLLLFAEKSYSCLKNEELREKMKMSPVRFEPPTFGLAVQGSATELQQMIYSWTKLKTIS